MKGNKVHSFLALPLLLSLVFSILATSKFLPLQFFFCLSLSILLTSLTELSHNLWLLPFIPFEQILDQKGTTKKGRAERRDEERRHHKKEGRKTEQERIHTKIHFLSSPFFRTDTQDTMKRVKSSSSTSASVGFLLSVLSQVVHPFLVISSLPPLIP